MDQILCAIENPLMDVTYENEWSIQDPDLMPTTADWALCHRFFMTDKRAGGILLSLDGRGFLDTFFHQPAPLRLVLCAAAAHFSLETSEQVTLSYYNRMGQPAIGQPFFKVALDMCSALMLHIDPDDSPWLHHLQLTEIEKEERRRFFWNCVFTLRTEQSFSADAIQLDLPTGGVRPMRAVTEPYSALPSMDSHGPLCNVYGVIVAIKRHHTVVPTSVEEIITSESVLALGNYLLKVHSSMEDRFLLIAESPQFVSWSDESCDASTSFTVSRNTRHYYYGNRTICGICITDFRLLSFLVKIAETEKRFSIQAHTQPLYPAFESAIVIWFLICRMDPEWRTTVPSLLNQNWKDFRDRLLFLLEFVKGLLLGQHHESGMLMPIITCMQAMMTEVVETLLTGASPGSAEPVEEIIVGMKVCSIGAEEHDEPSITREPWAFLGLLGMEVGPGLRWSGRSEDEWRRFWKKY
ncbi:hypothetical protein BCR33DRAFT_734893 [Rhizoclosmatium globosum]|uniref:Transcription factor domain-containing protein n=1 Tax=Rhizoclosmatium globosum TaxID=329046 RepID=A0A1Y2CQV1_9FUNG|nr:hypothetical protein BCR33DRAFT_734893 [Rhizoclosmatium globosum]|eukprot:ORY49408.1 hypothetical protein BCR33DRAFT_734893 [Rhizoclosmatium globosum]